MYYIGIDIGSTCAKAVVVDERSSILCRLAQPTGWNSADAAQRLRCGLADQGWDPEAFPCVATGYGRISVPYADKCLTEISCHGMGAAHLHGLACLTVIDIGGQDTKMIRVEQGAVRDFLMNDKCSAGTGRFLEVMANTLAVSPEELCRMAACGGGISISSMCTVFAESEVVGLIGRGEQRENIAFAVVDSIVKKTAAQAGRLDASGPICLTGGLSSCTDFCSALSTALGKPVLTSGDGRYAGAVGAALHAQKIGGHG